MQTQSLIFMLVSETIIVSLTAYFFLKVLFTKKKKEPDSYSENN
jgi:hypothetical protein